MDEFLIRELATDNIYDELSKIDFDESYKSIAQYKFKYKNIKIYNLNPAQANILKQTALTIGSDCATNKDVITGKSSLSNVILTGSISQLNKIAEKLQNQPFRLNDLGLQIKNFLYEHNRSTKIVGILNVTPNSFSDGGKYLNFDDAIRHFDELVNDGADMIDIGAESTKPYSQPVSAKEQIERLEPILKYTKNINFPISIDTRSSEVADFALNHGVGIINDVSGFEYDENMANVVSKYKAGIILQHSKGTPIDMQNNPMYDDVLEEIYFSLKQKIDYARSLGIENITIDPGIGFGKTKIDNLQILNNVEEFYSLGCPIMIGHSRKSFLGVDDNNIRDSLTLAFSLPLILKNVDFLRVHNVKLHKTLIQSLNKID